MYLVPYLVAYLVAFHVAVPRPVPHCVNHPVTCPPSPTVNSPVEQGGKPCFKNDFISTQFLKYVYYLFSQLTNLNIYIIFNIFNLFFNICLFNLIFLNNMFSIIFKTVYIISYLIYQFLKIFYKYILFVTFLYIFIINCKYLHASKSILKQNDYYIFKNSFNETRYLRTMTGPTSSHHQSYKEMNLTEIQSSSPQGNGMYQYKKSWIFSLILLIFLNKLKNRKSKNLLFFSLLNTFIIFMLFSSIDYQIVNNNRNSDLKSCIRAEFYTIESINISNKISDTLLSTNFNLLTISKLKYNNSA